MKKKIILLGYTQHLVNIFFCGMYKTLKEEGHNVVKVFELGDEPGEDEAASDWTKFDFSFIEKFRPDKIVVFNGYAKESMGAMSWLRNHYKVLFCERGWLPQADNLYIDSMGLGARSSLALTDLSYTKATPRQVRSAVEELYEKYYKTDGFSELGEYILVPLQLDHDTSIVLDSPYIKTMNSLVHFVKRSFPKEQIIITPHPKNPGVELPDGVTPYFGERTVDLAKSAKAVVGINSTSMIESLIHYTPVAMLGDTILNPSGVVLNHKQTLGFPRNILEWKPDPKKIDNVLFNLLTKQFNRFLVPELIIKQIVV